MCNHIEEGRDTCRCNEWIEVDVEGVQPGHQYYLSCELVSYAEYESVCQERGGQTLRSFNGKEEQLATILNEIGGILNSTTYSSTWHKAWVGLQFINAEEKGIFHSD